MQGMPCQLQKPSKPRETLHSQRPVLDMSQMQVGSVLGFFYFLLFHGEGRPKKPGSEAMRDMDLLATDLT